MPEPLTLAQIAARLGGRVVGDDAVLIRQVGSLERAGAGQIAFLANPKYRAQLATTRASAVVMAPAAEALTALPRILSDNPYAYFARLARLLNPEAPPEPGIDAAARVSSLAAVPASARVEAGATVGEGARIGERVSIGAGCHVGANAVIGDDSRLHPSVVVYDGCRIGARALIHSGAVIGADGFGIAEDGGVWVKVPQIGGVLIGDDVEIGASTTIDRGTIDDTVIEDGVKLDNQIQIGHNARIGAHTAMAGCAGVAGSATIGRHCTIGGAARILGHLTLADHVHVTAAAVISRSIRRPGTYSGIFPFDEHAAWTRNAALIRHLAELEARIRALEKGTAGKAKHE